MPNDLIISNQWWRLGVRPSVGAALTFGQVLADDGPLDLLSPTSFLGRVTGSFPLIPWSNRIGGGLLERAGEKIQLRIDDDAGATAIHGVVRDYPWEVLAADAVSCRLGFSSDGLVGLNWPWAFSAEISYSLDGPRLGVTTGLTNQDATAWPAGFGHHPYFNRRLVSAGNDEVIVKINCNQSYDLVDCLAAGPAGPVPPKLDFRAGRGFGGEIALDDCLTGRLPGELMATLTYGESGVVAEMRADALFSHVVLYAPQDGSGVFALEPVTNCNNGLALQAAGVPGTGVFELEPGQTAEASWSITLAS